METMMNPIGQVQGVIADILRASAWFKAHHVEIIEQNRQELSFLIRKKLSALGHVALVIGCDRLVNMMTGLESTITVTCTEHVLTNRARQGAVTAIDVCQAAIQLIDGEWWRFMEMDHTTEPQSDLLQATATFKGLVDRGFMNPNAEDH